MKFAVLSLSIVALGVLSGVKANAQVQLPQFSISNIPTIEMENTIPLDNEAAFARVMNPMMRDTLRLQYQINLLERLIRRQTEIERIAESYSKIGIPFKQPAPPEKSCMQLPINMLCMAFYPESAKYNDLIAERRQEFERDQARRMEMMMSQMDDFIVEEPALSNTGTAPAPRPRRVETPEDLYEWSDIRCVAGKCSALLVNRDDSSMRFRIRNGEELPTGGTISKISMAGVETSFEDEKYTLNAMAVSAAPRQTARSNAPNTEISDILGDRLGENASESQAMQDIAAENVDDQAIPAQTVVGEALNSVPDALGVTGLF